MSLLPASPHGKVSICTVLALLLAAGSAVGEEPANAAAVGTGANWTMPGGDLEGTRFSTLKQITPTNVGTLTEEFSYQTGQSGTHEGQPIVVGSVMSLVTPFPNQLISLDLKNGGAKLASYAPAANDAAYGKACCDVVNRGAMFYNGKIFFNTLDDTTVAVNASTDELAWSTTLGDPATGMTMTGAPIVADGVVLVGNAGGEFGVRGWVAGLEAATGKLLWQAYSTGSDADVKIGTGFHAYYAKDQGANLGETSWPGTLWQQGGGTAWSWITYDPELDMMYYGTSNPGVWNPDMRPGDNKWGATIFARKPKTGEAVWAYQVTPHDGWDYDAIGEMILVDETIDGVSHKLLQHFDKNGFAYTLDRSTGQVLSAKPFVNETWAHGINLVTGTPALVVSLLPHQGKPVSGICPSPFGGKDQEPASYSPLTGLFYVPTINLCNDSEALKAVYIKGAPFIGAATNIVAGPGTGTGALVAWNATKGAAAWTVTEPLPLVGGTLATAGGLVFYGTLDKHFKALDASTGKVLLDITTECGIASNPISYEAPDGKQRIAFYSGIGWIDGGFAGGACPTEGYLGSGGSGVLHVYKLP